MHLTYSEIFLSILFKLKESVFPRLKIYRVSYYESQGLAWSDCKKMFQGAIKVIVLDKHLLCEL